MFPTFSMLGVFTTQGEKCFKTLCRKMELHVLTAFTVTLEIRCYKYGFLTKTHSLKKTES